jgi:hypothetical protein
LAAIAWHQRGTKNQQSNKRSNCSSNGNGNDDSNDDDNGNKGDSGNLLLPTPPP